MSKRIPFEENHNFHGILIGVISSILLRFTGQPLGTATSVGAMIAAVAVAYMQSFGHDFFLQVGKGKDHDESIEST